MGVLWLPRRGRWLLAPIHGSNIASSYFNGATSVSNGVQGGNISEPEYHRARVYCVLQPVLIHQTQFDA